MEHAYNLSPEEVEVGASLSYPEIHIEFKASLSYMRLCHKTIDHSSLKKVP